MEYTKAGSVPTFLKIVFQFILLCDQGCKEESSIVARRLMSPAARPARLFCMINTALLICAPFHAMAENEPLSLRLRWLPGYTYTQETLTETTTSLTAIGKPEDQKMKVIQTTVIDVARHKSGEKRAKVTFKSLTGEVMLQGKKHSFDSTDLSGADPMIKASVGQSVGKSFVLVYGPDDQFIEVRDASSMSASGDGIVALDQIAEARQVADLYRRSLEMGLPKMSVKAGDRWTAQESVDFPSAGIVNVELHAKMDAVVDYEGRQHAKITFEGEMKRAEESVGTRTVTIGPGSKTFGQVLFDIERGTVSFGAFRADIKLEIGGKIVPVRQQVTTRLASLIKKES
jgi:hypothetical protein